MAPKELSQRALPGDRLGRRRCRPRAAADPDLLAGRRRAADHLGLDVTRGPAQDAAEPRHLPPAGDRAATRSSCAGWRTAAARSIFAIRHGQSGAAVSDRGGAGRRPGDHPRRGDAGAGYPVANTSSPGCCAARAPRSSNAIGQRTAGAGDAPRSCWKATSIRMRTIRRLRAALEGPFGDHTGYYNEQESFPGVHDRAHHHAARPDLSLDLHRQAARRAGRARRGAERSVRAAAAKAVSRDRRLLPAAGRLQLPHGGGAA